MRRRLCLSAIALLLLAALALPALAENTPAAPPAPVSKEQAKEERLGEKTAAELEKTLKPIPDHPQIAHLERIANEIAPHTERPQVHYTVKVVKSKAINAISIPGGRLYITEGALAAVESDDELAAILAHEIAHNSLRHAMQQQKRAQRGDLGVLAGIIAGIMANEGGIALMASQIQEGALNHYGRKAELEADAHGVTYLAQTKYRPIAMLTVLEGLAAMEESGPQPQVLTTAQDHPLAVERARVVQERLLKMGVDITAERRMVTARFKVEAKPLDKDGKTIAEITLNGKTVFSPAAALDKRDPLQRAQAYAKSLQEALRQGIQMIDLKVETAGGQSLVSARGQTLITITPADAEILKRPAADLAAEAKKAIELALYAERISRPF